MKTVQVVQMDLINNHIPLDKTIPPEISSSQLSSNRTIYIDENEVTKRIIDDIFLLTKM